MTPPFPAQTYRLDRRFALRIFGWRLVLGAFGAFATFVAFGFGGTGRAIGWVLLVLTLALLASAALVLVRPPRVISLNAQGVNLGRATGRGTRRVHWTTVVTVTTDQGRLVFDLAEGPAIVIPLALVPRRANALQREVNERLNAAHGYRRIN